MRVPPTRCRRCERPVEPGSTTGYCSSICRALARLGPASVSPVGSSLDDRGQATGISNFVIALLVGAIMTWAIEMLMTHLGPMMKDRANDPVANTAYQWSTTFLDNTPAIFLFTATLALLALSIYQRALLR